MKTEKQSVPGVKKIIAVASGKGGVGKSTTSVNLALALQAMGQTVGLLDADIYGPNQHHMLGAKRRATTQDNDHFDPVISHGLQSMSMGYLIEEDAPMIWRGPMVLSAFKQMVLQTAWSDVDILVIDLPPGTGDVQLTLAQSIPVTGAIVVTTPQDVALLDVRKALRMFEKVNIPVLGMIENMSSYHCPNCQHEDKIFGEGGGARLAEEFSCPLLGDIPLSRRNRELSDAGTPIVVSEPDSMIAGRYQQIAASVVELIAAQKSNAKFLFTNVAVERKE